jgi:hypothetical protein
MGQVQFRPDAPNYFWANFQFRGLLSYQKIFMTRTLTILLATTALACAALAAEKSLQLKDLPAAAQKTVQDNLKGGEIKNIGKETEKGVAQFEVESVLNGKHRDFNVDTKGKLIVIEEEISIDSIPAAAKATIMKRVGAGMLSMVETFTKPGSETMYEAAWKDKAGKKHEVLVKADGTETKD